MKIIKATKVDKEQEHFRIIIDSNPKIQIGLSNTRKWKVSKCYIDTAKNLEKAGVDLACIPCITAHYFFDEIQSQVSI